MRLASLLPALFGLHPQPGAALSGQVEVKSAQADALTLRASVEAKTGVGQDTRFSAEVPVSASGLMMSFLTHEAFVPGVYETVESRSNLILSETLGREAFVTITVYDGNGTVVGRLENQRVPPNGKVQWNRIVDKVRPGATLSAGSVGVKVTSGDGALLGVLTVSDNRSNSFSTAQVRCSLFSGVPSALVVPGAVRTLGAYDTLFSTNLHVVNGKQAAARVDLTFHYVDKDDGDARKTARVTVDLPPLGSLPSAKAIDAIRNLFGLTVRCYGWIEVTGDLDRLFAIGTVNAQVDPNEPPKGVKTSQMEGRAIDGCDVANRFLPPLRYSGAAKSVQKRTNLVLVEVGGVDTCRVRVRATSATGQVLAERDWDLEPTEYRQVNDVFGPDGLAMGDGPFQDVELSAQVVSGEGKLLSFAAVNDNFARNPEVWVLSPAGCPYSRQ